MTKAQLMDLPLFMMYLNEKTNLSESSVNLYTESIKSFLGGNPDIDKLEDYNNYIIKYAVKSRSTYVYAALKHFIKYLGLDTNLRESLFDSMIKPEIKDPITTRVFLNESKRIEVINNLEREKHQVIALLQTMTGVRAGDVLRLRKGRVFYEEEDGKPIVRLELIGKRKKKISTHIYNKDAQEIFIYYINKYNERLLDGYYFLEKGTMKNRPGQIDNEEKMKQINYVWYYDDLKQSLQKSGVNKDHFSTHDWRRCFSREIWDKYKDLQLLQRALNHANPATTMRYLAQSGMQNKDILKEYQK